MGVGEGPAFLRGRWGLRNKSALDAQECVTVFPPFSRQGIVAWLWEVKTRRGSWAGWSWFWFDVETIKA